MKNRKFVTGITLGLLVPAIFAAALIWFPPSFLKVQEVLVAAPLRSISERDLIRLAGVQKGTNLLTLRLKTVRSRLLLYPWIREVRLSKRFPGRLQIALEEQVPVALLGINKDLFLVNREGILFKKAGPEDPKDLPTINGLSEGEIPGHLKPLISLLGLFENSEELKPVGLSEIHWREGQGVSLFTRQPCVQVELGETDWNEKLDRLARAWETIRLTARNPKVVDLNFERRIIVKQMSSRQKSNLKKEVKING